MVLRPLLFFVFIAWPGIAWAAPEARAPIRGWTIDFDDAQCVAFRDYGSKEAPVKLVLKAPPIGNVVQVAVLRQGSSLPAQQVDGWVKIGERPRSKASVLAYYAKSSGTRVYSLNMPAAEFALVLEAQTLSIQAGDLDEQFTLSQMAPLMKVVEECVADLRAVFHIRDPQSGEESPLPSRARANIARLFDSDDYPWAALREDQTGIVKFVLLIDETGRVADCTVIETSGVATLDAQACAVLRARAKFEPARGPDGKPAKDAVTARVIWRIS